MAILTTPEEREAMLREALLREELARPLPVQDISYAPGTAPGGVLRQAPVSPPMPSTGNRRDSVQGAPPRSETPMSAYQQPSLLEALNPFGSWEANEGLFRFGLAMLGGGPDFGSKIRAGLKAWDDYHASQRDQARQSAADQRAQETHDLSTQRARLELQQLQEQIERGELVHVGNGFFYNKRTGEFIQPPQDIQDALLEFERRSASARAAPARMQQGALYVDADGNYYRETFDPATGAVSYVNQMTGQPVDRLPPGSFRAEDSGLRWQTKADVEELTAARQAARNAPGNIARLDRLESLGYQQAGQTVWAEVGRLLASKAGIEVGDFSGRDISEVKQIVADMAVDAAQRMRGQGQITEAERALLMRTIPNLDMDPEAFKTVIGILRKAEERSIELYDAWVDAPYAERQAGFGEFAYRYSRRWRDQTGPNPSGGRTSTGITFTIIE